MFGRKMNDLLGHLHFWGTFIFVNVTFLPQFRMGLLGHQRRIADPSTVYSLGDIKDLHILSTIGAVGLLLSQIPFLVNFFGSLFFGKKVDRNPWKSNTLEWTVDSPPPHGNFPGTPIVYRGAYEYSRPDRADDWWPQDLAPDETRAR
jgi:cytochrome c oxidase subunit 1